MGGGAWTTTAYCNYVKSTRGIDNVDTITTNSVNQFYNSRTLDPALDPKGVKFRECRDSDEHPNTIPIILGLDVTGSMGSACAAVARQLDKIITGLYADVKDVEFMVMGIGDFAYDRAPLQVSQFESDVRICDQLGKIYFERGGGGNAFESYTAAWHFALNHTQLDCWNRGKKGIIITMGDEPLNPYLPGREFNRILGYDSQDVDTVDLYKQVTEKYDVYHIIITDPESSGWRYLDRDKESWGKLLDGQHLFVKKSDELPEVIHDIVTAHVEDSEEASVSTVTITEEGISW
jgi:hypothetical protein